MSGKRKAIVSAVPGTTRDRTDGDASIGGIDFTLMDTGGLEDLEVQDSIYMQVERAVQLADVTMYVADAKVGVTPIDQEMARWFHKLKTQGRDSAAGAILVANKCEGLGLGESDEWDTFLVDCKRLGLGAPIAISASQQEGMGDLHSALMECNERLNAGSTDDAEQTDEHQDDKPIIRIAIVGRPNAGKSTLLNRIVGEERVLAGPTPGLTRDSVAIDWHHAGHRMEIVDTAGLRRKGKIYEASRTAIEAGDSNEANNKVLESFASTESYRAISSANIVVVVVDVTAEMKASPATAEEATANLERDALTYQDKNILSRALSEGRGVVVVANKVDLIPDRFAVANDGVLPDHGDIASWVSSQLGWSGARDVPIIPMSAIDDGDEANGKGIIDEKLFPVIMDVHRGWNTRLPTSKLQSAIGRIVDANPPSMSRATLAKATKWTNRGKLSPVKIKFASQTGTRPPTISLFINKSDVKNALDESYLSYLEGKLREEFKLWGVPIRFDVRPSKNPFRSEKRMGGRASKMRHRKKK